MAIGRMNHNDLQETAVSKILWSYYKKKNGCQMSLKLPNRTGDAFIP